MSAWCKKFQHRHCKLSLQCKPIRPARNGIILTLDLKYIIIERF